MTTVVKIGGGETVDLDAVATDVAHLDANGETVIVVHGGSTAIDRTLKDLGIETEFVETPDGVVGRFTDAATLEGVTMALAWVNAKIVSALHASGVRAVGLSGLDGGLVSGTRRSAVRAVQDGRTVLRRGDHSGSIERVDTDLIEAVHDGGYVPVVTVPMLGRGDGYVGPVNVDADAMAAAIAGATAARIVFLTDVPGILADPNDSSTIIEKVDTPVGLDACETAATGFMTRKLMAATAALEGGATVAIVADGRHRDPISTALDGAGTHLEPAAVAPEGEAP